MRNELPIHDAAFDGLVTAGKACTLYFRRSDGRACEILLMGVDALQMEDFREGNIVILFETLTGHLPKNSLSFERLYPPPPVSAPEAYQSAYAEFIGKKIKSIEAGELTFVQMQPAIGANLLAICERVQLKFYGDDNQ